MTDLRQLAHRAGYLLLSVFAGLLELGVIMLAIRNHWPLVALPLAAIAYQIGAVLVEPIGLRPAGFLMLGITGTSLLFIMSAPTFPQVLLPIALISAGIQGGRDVLGVAARVSTLVKRLARILGFLLSGVVALGGIVWLGVASVTILGLTALSKAESPAKQVGLKAGPEAALMLVHQAHYFCYASIIPLLLVETRLLPVQATGVLFSVGWISYAFAPSLLRRNQPIPTFVLGHLFAASVLVGIALFASQPLVVLALWFLTGLGGGTVFIIRKLERRSPTPLGLDGWENAGHVLGLSISAIVVSAFGALAVFPAAALIALLTALMMSLLAARYGWAALIERD